MSARCSFYIINRGAPDRDRFQTFVPRARDGVLVLDDPPAVGDLITLSGQTPASDDEYGPLVDKTGVFKVLARCWDPATYGSMNWPSGMRQHEPIQLDIMIEETEGIFSEVHYREGTDA